MSTRFSFSILLIICWLSTDLWAQDPQFTRQDSLRGSITAERAWWDLNYYHLSVEVNPADSSFTGSNLIGFRALEAGKIMQIDLQPPMKITKIIEEAHRIVLCHGVGSTDQ